MTSYQRTTSLGQLRDDVAAAVARATDFLYSRQRTDGSWADRLSSSAIPTALGVLALARHDRGRHTDAIAAGLRWLRSAQRHDGGWSVADDDDPSDGSVTAFAVAALQVLAADEAAPEIARGEAFIEKLGGDEAILPNVRTWRELVAVTWAMEGLRDIRAQPVQPVEVMLLPARLRNRASIALPGVIGLGIGQSRIFPAGRVRRLAQRRAEKLGLAWLRSVMADDGGIEECPLMAAVVFTGLNVAGPDVGADIQDGCIRYLRTSQREDGSWPIDRDLEIAVTAYSVFALDELGDVSAEPRLRLTREWLTAAQWREPYPALGMPAGGWSWANPSGWPESEDTAVAISALRALGAPLDDAAVRLGIDYLFDRQNKDGSWSEWMRNSSMVHDGPCPGVTGHVLMALHHGGHGPARSAAMRKALRWFPAAQQSDGAFASLWFRDTTHGTAKVVETYAELGLPPDAVFADSRRWLLANQREDGAWPATVVEGPPGGGTAEETAWALYSLLRAGDSPEADSVLKAVRWLLREQTAEGTWRPRAVGLYYDQMYYSSDLITHSYSLRALARWLRSVQPTDTR